MATVIEVGKLENSHPHTRVVAVALRQPLAGKCTTPGHHISTINPPNQEQSFTPRGGPNLGKTACVIPTVLPCIGLLFVRCDYPLPSQQGAVLVPQVAVVSRNRTVTIKLDLWQRGFHKFKELTMMRLSHLQQCLSLSESCQQLPHFMIMKFGKWTSKLHSLMDKLKKSCI